MFCGPPHESGLSKSCEAPSPIISACYNLFLAHSPLEIYYIFLLLINMKIWLFIQVSIGPTADEEEQEGDEDYEEEDDDDADDEGEPDKGTKRRRRKPRQQNITFDERTEAALIDWYKDHPEFYNPRLKIHRDTERKNALLKEKAEEVGLESKYINWNVMFFMVSLHFKLGVILLL